MVGVGGSLDDKVRGAILVPERGGNGVPWSSASKAGLVAVAFKRAVALWAADLREKTKSSIRVLTAESLEINCGTARSAFRQSWKMKSCLKMNRSVLSLVLLRRNRVRSCVVAALWWKECRVGGEM